MARLSDFLCTERSTHPAVSSKLLEDQRRLDTFLGQERRFIPSNLPVRRSIDEVIWINMLESVYEVRLPIY